MGKFILRVDDVGWLPPEKTRDVGLAYFSKWRELMGLKDCPVYYGTIPSQIGTNELTWCSQQLTGREELAVHGNTHAKGELVEASTMLRHREHFDLYRRCRTYIPPFNDYTDSTINRWQQACRHGYFFGGFHNEHHRHGNLPTKVEGIFHLPAFRETYDHTEQLLEQIPLYADLDCPIVVTLHCTWAWNKLELLPKLAKLIEPHLVSIDHVDYWYQNATLNLKQLTAPHYLAYKSILDGLGSQLGLRVLDFGSRYSALPSLMALRGCRVTALDRDERIHQYQQEVADRYGSPKIETIRMQEPQHLDSKFDVITCCWSLQHNMPRKEILKIVTTLVDKLNPRGRLLIVGSYNHEREHEQLNRADPQIVLDTKGYEELILRPSEMKVLACKHFYYEHNTIRGNYCDAAQANAVFYELVRQ